MSLKLWLRIALVLTTFDTTFALAGGTEKFFENASSNGALLNLLRNSKKSLDIEIYQMDDLNVHQALRSALSRGVRVRVIQEPRPVASTCSPFAPPAANDTKPCAADKQLVADIRAKGGVYVPFNTPQLCARGVHCFEHGKLVISDGQYAFLSTGNFNPTNLCDKQFNPATCNRDYSVLTWDPGSVRTLQAIFDRDLIGKPYDFGPILSHPDAKKVTVSPFSLQPLVNFINSAKKLIQVENQYLKDPELNRALMQAAQRGVKVYVMVSSACAFGKPSGSEITNWTQVFTAFDQAGILSRMFTHKISVGGIGGYLHAKAILVDSTRAWIGSVNGSTLSLTQNREYGIFIDDETEALKLGAFLKNDFLEPNGENWHESLQCKNDWVAPRVEGSENGNGLYVQ